MSNIIEEAIKELYEEEKGILIEKIVKEIDKSANVIDDNEDIRKYFCETYGEKDSSVDYILQFINEYYRR